MSEARPSSPKTLAEVYELLGGGYASMRLIAGGTDLMVLVNAHQLDARELIDIWGVDELRGITSEGEHLRIGALATWSQIVRSRLAVGSAPALIESARTIGALQIQNRGTIGGNVVNASPAGDSLPVLAAFDAEVEIGSSRGTRKVGFNQFYTAYRKTVLEAGEIVTAIRIPKVKSGEQGFYYKVGTRRAQAISKVVMGVRLRMNGDQIEEIAIGLGSVAPTVIRASRTEQLLTGKRVSRDLIASAQLEIAHEISAITDLRSTEHYRRVVTGNLIARLLKKCGVRSAEAE